MSTVARVTASIRISGGVGRRSDIDHPRGTIFTACSIAAASSSAPEHAEDHVESDDRDHGLHPPGRAAGEDGVEDKTDRPDESEEREQRDQCDEAAR